jgi:hypothetical protein
MTVPTKPRPTPRRGRPRWAARTTKRPTIEGTPYRSKFEVGIAADLEARGVPFEYEKLRLKYTTEHTYKPDFTAGTVVIEAKGYFTSEDRSKLLAVKKANPDLDLRLLFQRASNKLFKESETTYADWADKHGFPWAEGRVPDEWLKAPGRKDRGRVGRQRRAIPGASRDGEAPPHVALGYVG